MSVSVAEFDPLSTPLEIWSQVFSYLQLEDRKNVRLTCHRFYDACCTHQLQLNEELVFEGNFNSHRAIQSLCDTERKVWNIKLTDVDLNESIVPFFEKHGADVHSLTLIDCPLKPRVLRDILGPCGNLRSFAFLRLNSLRRPVCDENLYQTVFPEFEELQRRGILYSKVDNLALELRSSLVITPTNVHLSRIFAIFPNITKLSVKLTVFRRDAEMSNLLSSDATSDKAFSIAPIYHLLLRIHHQLEELTLTIICHGDRRRLETEAMKQRFSIEMKNVRKLALNSNLMHITDTSFNFQHLTSLTCEIGPDVTTSSPKVLHILNSYTKLNSLTLLMECHMVFSKECFVALVKSQLKSLKVCQAGVDIPYDALFTFVRADFHPSCLDDSLAPNYTLNHIEMHSNDYILLLLFSEYFLCLENFHVLRTKVDILDNICNQQLKLRSLVLYHPERFPYNKIRPKHETFGYGISNLEISPHSQLGNLTRLHVVDRTTLELSQFLLSKIVFSKLRSLTILMEEDCRYSEAICEMDALWQLIQKLTQLEHFEMYWRNEDAFWTFRQWLNLFESLPKLRHFSCTDSCLVPFYDSEYRQLFHMRSSLRSVRHTLIEENRVIKSVKYQYDVITNTVECT